MRRRRRPLWKPPSTEEPTSGLRNGPEEEAVDWPPDPDALRLMKAYDQLPRLVRDAVGDAVCQWSTPDLAMLVQMHGVAKAVHAIEQSDLRWLIECYKERFWPEDVELLIRCWRARKQ